MRLALKEAEKGKHKTWPNPWIGCVIVKGGKLISRGFHERAGFPHAEIEALNRAGARAKGATLYVTLEPCNHQGKTGPCAQAIVRAGIARVVAGAPDPNPSAQGGLRTLRRHGVEVGPWTLRAQAEALNLDFLRSVRLGRPWFILKAGASLDGKTALPSGESKWITSQAARRDARRLRALCDGVLVGAGTVLKDHPRLLPDKPGRFIPARMVLDPRARLKGRERIFNDRHSGRSIWFAGPGLTPRRERHAKAAGVTVVRIKVRELKAFLKEAVAWMGGRFRRVLVEGGSQTHGAFADLGLFDEAVLYLAPALLGGERSKGVIGGEGPHSLAKLARLKHIQLSMVGGDLRVQGDVHRNH
jgi:diaminohydroxyphosphoribosylaminopyrimidine deaminase/5-amino-6-(5-phosphoribosylamino)uracil reductase